MIRGVDEAGDLLVLSRQIVDRVEDEVGQRELAGSARVGEVSDRDADGFPVRLVPHAGDHRLRYVDAVHLHAATGEGQCDTACPHTEFQRPTIAGEIGQNIDDRVDHALVVHAGRGGVVAGGDLLLEVPVCV